MAASHPSPEASAPQQALRSREIIVAVCGGIAAYKTAELVSKLVQAGAGVTVAMTRAARKFVTPLTFQSLSGRPVRTDMFASSGDVQHIDLTEKANLMVIAPATANIIAKAAAGICDDLVSLLIAAAGCPVVFCPAMNSRMWVNPIAQENYRKLQSLGYTFIGPDEGWLACRSVGAGRMSEPQVIFQTVVRMLAETPPAGSDRLIV